jgi:hypothetical protein
MILTVAGAGAKRGVDERDADEASTHLRRLCAGEHSQSAA